jgi:hypothetical protein
MTPALILARRHAWLRVAAADLRVVATRWPDTERGMQAADDAAAYTEEADALQAALALMPDVHVPAPGQLSLFSEGTDA